MNQTSKSPSETNFGASFPLNKLLVQRTNGCFNCPVQLI